MSVKMAHSDHKLAAAVWIAILLLMSVWAMHRVTSGNAIDSDILNLLPRTQQQDIPRESQDNLYQQQNRQLVIVIAHQRLDTALDGARQLQALTAPDLIKNFTDNRESLSELKAVAGLYQPFARNLVTDQDYRALRNQDYASLTTQALQTLYSPLSAVNSSLLRSDPLFSFTRFIESIQGDTRLQWADGWPYLNQENRYYVVYAASLQESPFNLELQDRLVPSISHWRTTFKQQHTDSDVYYTGALFYAHHGVQSAKQEISLVGLGSLAGILMLFLLAFRGLKPLVMMVIAISAGVLSGFTAVLLLFPQIHIMALVFGATLLGISIDYSFHFFAEYYYGKKPLPGAAVVSRIRVAILLGLVSSAVAYLSLLFGDFPGLHQIALFSAAGLAAACLTVLLLYPVFCSAAAPEKQKTENGFQAVVPALIARVNSPALFNPVFRRVLTAGLLLVSIAGITKLTPDDDIRLLQPVSEQLKTQQSRIESLFNQGQAQQFFMIRAASLQGLLEKEEALRETLHSLKQKNLLGEERMLSEYLPSADRQQQTSKMLAAFYQSSAADNYFSATGIPQPEKKTSANDILELTDFYGSPLEPQIQRFLLANDKEFISAVFLQQIHDLDALKSLADPANGMFWIDRTGDISEVFESYRVKAGKLLLFAVLTVLVFLVLRYRLARGLLATGVPVLACTCVLGILGYTSAPFNLFHLLGLMVVLGLGLDYAIFLSEYHDQQQATLIAISLSVITTLLAFGLLGLSSTPAVSSFGVVVAMGVTVNFILSILLLATNRSETARIQK